MIKFEKFNKLDFERLITWIDSEETMIQFSDPLFSYPLTFEQLEYYVKIDNRLLYKIIDPSINKIIGHAEIHIDNENCNARLRHILIGNKQNRNKGYGKAIMKELIRIAFDDLKLHRLDLGVYKFNKQAVKCFRHCGFKKEGILKENKKVGDTYWSTLNMAIINKQKA
jgi:RimJ/RimL family protein N-acetyltransferase